MRKKLIFLYFTFGSIFLFVLYNGGNDQKNDLILICVLYFLSFFIAKENYTLWGVYLNKRREILLRYDREWYAALKKANPDEDIGIRPPRFRV